MHDMTEWGALPDRSRALSPSKDRLVYLQYLRRTHDDEGFRLALSDGMRPSEVEVETFLTEVEMLANYGVI